MGRLLCLLPIFFCSELTKNFRITRDPEAGQNKHFQTIYTILESFSLFTVTKDIADLTRPIFLYYYRANTTLNNGIPTTSDFKCYTDISSSLTDKESVSTKKLFQ